MVGAAAGTVEELAVLGDPGPGVHRAGQLIGLAETCGRITRQAGQEPALGGQFGTGNRIVGLPVTVGEQVDGFAVGQGEAANPQDGHHATLTCAGAAWGERAGGRTAAWGKGETGKRAGAGASTTFRSAEKEAFGTGAERDRYRGYGGIMRGMGGGDLEYRSLEVAGVRRGYWLARGPAAGPLLVALHGSGTSGKDMATTFTGLSDRAPEAGVRAVFPDGWREVWHIARPSADEPRLDDVAFLRELVASLGGTRRWPGTGPRATGSTASRRSST
jgi:hypothetical protein